MDGGASEKKNMFKQPSAEKKKTKGSDTVSAANSLIEKENKPKSSQHLRSLTSHKLNRPAIIKPGKETTPLNRGHSEEHRNAANITGTAGQDLRASITYEETTGQAKKFDNCVTKFSFATKTGFSPSNPYKVN